MPTWSGTLTEIQTLLASGVPNALDVVRRKYLVGLHQHTGRNVILYASKFTQADPGTPPEAISINEEDLQGLMEVVHGLGSNRELDLVLHSPGGSLEAAEALVNYLRSKFTHIRVIVPHLAMSAATMIACAADGILMGKHSFLGPTDPQLVIVTPTGPRLVAMQAILEQFADAVRECQDPRKLAAWAPMLSLYGPDLLVRCRNGSAMSEKLVADWLARYMFKSRPKKTARAKGKAIAGWLSNHGHFKSHARHIPRDQLEEKGLLIEHLEADQKVQELVLSLYHATTITFSLSAVVKMMENHLGRAYMRTIQVAPPSPAAPSPAAPAQQLPPPPMQDEAPMQWPPGQVSPVPDGSSGASGAT